MAVKRKTYELQKGEIIDREEYHDGNYGAPGKSRGKKKKLTKEDMQRVNHENKFRRARHRLLKYFKTDDYFITWTFEMSKRPESKRSLAYPCSPQQHRGYCYYCHRCLEAWRDELHPDKKE